MKKEEKKSDSDSPKSLTLKNKIPRLIKSKTTPTEKPDARDSKYSNESQDRSETSLLAIEPTLTVPDISPKFPDHSPVVASIEIPDTTKLKELPPSSPKGSVLLGQFQFNPFDYIKRLREGKLSSLDPTLIERNTQEEYEDIIRKQPTQEQFSDFLNMRR